MRASKAKHDLRMCFGKSRYPTESRANVYREKAESARKVKLRVYHCPICQGYHMTKQVATPDPQLTPLST